MIYPLKNLIKFDYKIFYQFPIMRDYNQFLDIKKENKEY
jgi:hypothetical protein